RLAEPGPGPVHRGAVPPGLPGHRLEGVAALFRSGRALHRLRCGTPHLPQAELVMSATSLPSSPRLDQIEAIAIGGSAGAVEALNTLLPALRAGLPMPVFVVLHLPRDGPSLLPQIFQHLCRLRTAEAEHGEPIEPGTVYFAPPDYHLLVDRGPQIALSVDEPVHFSRPSIDVLFESAADLYGPGLLGIVLTGAS